MYGDVDVGKTFYASCIANAVIQKHAASVKALSIPTLLNELTSSSDKAGYIRKLVGYDLLILDDFGAQRKTEFATEQLFNIIDERLKTNKPLIITSNYDLERMLSADPPTEQKRILDRIKGVSLPIECKGRSKRRLLRSEEVRKPPL